MVISIGWAALGVILLAGAGGLAAHALTRNAARVAAALAKNSGATPPRISGSEIGEFVGAIVPLLGAIGTLYTAVVNPKLDELTRSQAAAVAARDSARAELAGVRDTVAGMLHFELRTWKRLPPAVMATGTQGTVLDDRAATAAKGDCGPVAVASFQASGPATVQCDSGSFRVRLTRPTRILLVPSGP